MDSQKLSRHRQHSALTGCTHSTITLDMPGRCAQLPNMKYMKALNC
jgi:hypothetical protein